MINEDLIKSDVISQEELSKILNPFTQEELEKYAKDLCLSGFETDYINFFDAFRKYIETGDTRDFYKEFEKQNAITVIRYKKLVDNIWVSCQKDDEGAVSYEYVYTPFIKVYDNSDNNYVSVLSIDVQKELEGLKYWPYNDVADNIIKLQELFIYSDRFPSALAIELLTDVKNKLNEFRQKANNDRGKYWDKELYEIHLRDIKRQYIKAYNALEDLSKPLGYNRNYTDGSELDRGL